MPNCSNIVENTVWNIHSTMNLIKVICFCLLLYVLGYSVGGDNSSSNFYQVKRYLHNLLLQNYSKDIHPVLDHKKPVTIYVVVFLKAIINYDEIGGTLSMSLGLELSWTDELLKWNPASYHNISALRIPSSEVWTPRLFSPNAFDTFSIDMDNSRSVVYLCNGTSKYTVGVRSSTLCSPNSRYFPFDTQKCHIEIVTLATYYEEIFVANHVNEHVFEENPVWKLESIKLFVDNDEEMYTSVLRIIIKIQRRHSFFMVNIFAPIIFLAFVNLFVFMLPVESGERVSYAITVLLSFTVFLSLLTDYIPKSSLTISLFSIYMFTVLAYSSLITLSVVIISDIHFTVEGQSPKSILSRMVVGIMRGPKTKIRNVVTEVTPTDIHTDNEEKQTNYSDTDYKTISCTLDKVFINVYAILFVLITIFFMTFIGVEPQAEQN